MIFGTIAGKYFEQRLRDMSRDGTLQHSEP